jgi:hypothetical protein
MKKRRPRWSIIIGTVAATFLSVLIGLNSLTAT